MAVIWETTDRLGRIVRLTDEGWAHVLAGHRDMVPFLAAMRVAVEEADEVFRDGRYPQRDVHYLRSDGQRPSLKVVGKYRPTAPSGWTGEVITAFRSRRKGKGERRIWP